MKIAIGNDHAGVALKVELSTMLTNRGIEVINYGTDELTAVDYPDYIHQVAAAVSSNEVDRGIVICGSGNGANMTANKHRKVRSALCWTSEIAQLAKQHNDANVISIPARYVSIQEGKEIVKTFLKSKFEGGRHRRRIDKIEKI